MLSLPRGPNGEFRFMKFLVSHYSFVSRVENILTGQSEQEKVLFSTPEFMILPDMKWDLTTISSLYLVAIVQDRSLRSLRDLQKKHLGLLQSIRDQAEDVVKRKWRLEKGSLRMFVHYQPSYCKYLAALLRLWTNS